MTGVFHTDFGRNVYALLGLPFDAVTSQEAVDHLRDAMNARKPCLWVTPNVNFVVAANSDAAFRSAILKAHLSTVDGMPLVWLARWIGIPLFERVSGSNTFDSLCQSETSVPVQTAFLFGGDDGVAEVAHHALNSRGVRLRSVGWLSPGRGSVDQLSRAEHLETIRRSGADFLLVSLGAVKGHLWIDRNWSSVGTPVVSHLGAVLNFLAGTVHRAPKWMQSAGLEWVWRIFQEKTLWSRYLNDGKQMFNLVRNSCIPYKKLDRKWRMCAGQHPASVAVRFDSDRLNLQLSGVFLAASITELRRVCMDLNHESADVTVDAFNLNWLDSAAMGLLLLLHSHQSKNGRKLHWHGPALVRIFAAHGCEYLIDQMEDNRLAEAQNA